MSKSFVEGDECMTYIYFFAICSLFTALLLPHKDHMSGTAKMGTPDDEFGKTNC
jgi:hypothetical protein